MINKLRILKLFENSGGRLISNGEIVAGNFYGTKPIIEYSARICDARKLIGCLCGNSKGLICRSDKHIKSVKKNYFQYINNSIDTRDKIMSTPPREEITETKSVDKQLGELRQKWTIAKSHGNKFQMKALETLGKKIKNGDFQNQKPDFKQTVVETLGLQSTSDLSGRSADVPSSFKMWK